VDARAYNSFNQKRIVNFVIFHCVGSCFTLTLVRFYNHDLLEGLLNNYIVLSR
jgi:hypothetical protein